MQQNHEHCTTESVAGDGLDSVTASTIRWLALTRCSFDNERLALRLQYTCRVHHVGTPAVTGHAKNMPYFSSSTHKLRTIHQIHKIPADNISMQFTQTQILIHSTKSTGTLKKKS